jgi:hypothetical protein
MMQTLKRAVWDTFVAVLLIVPPAAAAAPVNDLFANAIQLTGASVVTNGSNVGATKEPGEPDHAGDAGGKSVWWLWTAPFTGSVFIHTTGSSFDTLLGVYVGSSLSALKLITANDQDPLDPLGGDTSRVKFNAIAETVYAIAVDGFAGASGTIRLTIAAPPRPPNDDFAQRIVLTGTSILTNGSTFDATKEPNEPNHAGEPGGKSIWWSWTAPSAGRAIITTAGSYFDTVLAVYRGETVDDLVEIASNDQDPLGGDTSRVSFPTAVGQHYEIAVDGWNGESGVVALKVRLVFPPQLSIGLPAGECCPRLRVAGAAASRYEIEGRAGWLASNAWQPLATNTTDASGLWFFTDYAATNLAQRFYRARALE